MPTLFVSLNASGCGHYNCACLGDKESEQLENEEQSGKKVNKEECPHVSCSCGVSRKGQGPSSNICATTSLGHTQAGASPLKQEFDVVEIVHSKDVQTHLINEILEIPRWSALLENVESLIFKIVPHLSLKSICYETGH